MLAFFSLMGCGALIKSPVIHVCLFYLLAPEVVVGQRALR